MTVNMSLNRLTTGGVSTNTGAFQTPTATVLFSDYNAHTIQAGDACQCDLVRLVAYDRPLSTTEEFQLADYMERTYWPTPKDRYYFYGFDNNADGYGNFLPELQTSNDLVTWTTRPIGFDGATMRDPSYLWWRGEMYQVNTCCALQFEVKHSYTGGLWTHYGNLSGGTQTGSYSSTWAPEFYVQHGSTGDTAYVFWSFDPANGDVEHQTNASYSTDAHLAINSWSAPAVVTITGANYNSIDVFLFDEGSTRYMLIKNENSGNIEVASQAASADPISGTWAMVKTGDWAGWRASYGAPVEGPSIIRRRDGKYQVFLDPINGAAPYQCSVSSGPVFASATWSAPAPCGFNAMTWPVSGNLTHGTIYDSRGQGGAVAFDPVIDQLHRGLLAMFPMPGAVGN
jgi:hypothetical protein